MPSCLSAAWNLGVVFEVLFLARGRRGPSGTSISPSCVVARSPQSRRSLWRSSSTSTSSTSPRLWPPGSEPSAPLSGTARTWRVTLSLRSATCQLRKVSADHLARLVRTSREKGLAPWTIKGMLTPLGSGSRAGAASRVDRREPAPKRLQPEELPKGCREGSAARPLPRGDRQACSHAAPDRYRPIIGVAVLAGLRQAEVLGLRWLEIDFKAGVLKVRHQLDPRRSNVHRLARRGSRRRPASATSSSSPTSRHLAPDAPARRSSGSSGLPRPDDFVFTTSTGQLR